MLDIHEESVPSLPSTDFCSCVLLLPQPRLCWHRSLCGCREHGTKSFGWFWCRISIIQAVDIQTSGLIQGKGQRMGMSRWGKDELLSLGA